MAPNTCENTQCTWTINVVWIWRFLLWYKKDGKPEEWVFCLWVCWFDSRHSRLCTPGLIYELFFLMCMYSKYSVLCTTVLHSWSTGESVRGDSHHHFRAAANQSHSGRNPRGFRITRSIWTVLYLDGGISSISAALMSKVIFQSLHSDLEQLTPRGVDSTSIYSSLCDDFVGVARADEDGDKKFQPSEPRSAGILCINTETCLFVTVQLSRASLYFLSSAQRRGAWGVRLRVSHVEVKQCCLHVYGCSQFSVLLGALIFI